MTCYLYMDGVKQEMDEDIFDQMGEALHQSNNTNPPIPEKLTRHRPDGTYDKRPLDPGYFTKYYHNKLKTPYQCPDCGRIISSKSNLSKHRNTKLCQKHRC